MNIIEWIKGLFKKPKAARHGNKWRKEDDLQLGLMLGSMISDDEIARRLGRTKRAVQQRKYILSIIEMQENEQQHQTEIK